MADIQGIIDRIMSDERLKRSSHFSDAVFTNEPIIKTGRQMSSYLPQRYREMRAISRWQEGAGGRAGRWLSEAELFVRQAEFMADFEDDCPYQGDFKAYFPTYGSLNDRQLRGYFTWRTRVRSGEVQAAPASFAYLYLYELIAGIGYGEAVEGLRLMRRFCDAFSAHDRAILRLGGVWVQDFAVYHGLPADLLGDTRSVRHDRALVALRNATEAARGARERNAAGLGRRGPKGLPLPAQDGLECTLLESLDELSTYRIRSGRLYREAPGAVAHVAGSVWLRLADHYARSRKSDIIESMFGSTSELPYTMFASAVFFDPLPHPDSDYELDPVHRYRCRNGLWTCERVHGAGGRSAKLGSVLRAVDGRLRAGIGFGPSPQGGEGPQIPCRDHRRRGRGLDRVAGSACAPPHRHRPQPPCGHPPDRRGDAEALLVDEEREGTGTMLDVACRDSPSPDREANGSEAGARPGRESTEAEAGAPIGSSAPSPATDPAASGAHAPASERDLSAACRDRLVAAERIDGAAEQKGASARAGDPRAGDAAENDTDGDGRRASFLHALLERDQERASRVAREAGTTVDLLADAVNEALFDAIGDTAVEFDANGPHIVEDYREDIEELLTHD